MHEAGDLSTCDSHEADGDECETERINSGRPVMRLAGENREEAGECGVSSEKAGDCGTSIVRRLVNVIRVVRRLVNVSNENDLPRPLRKKPSCANACVCVYVFRIVSPGTILPYTFWIYFFK